MPRISGFGGTFAIGTEAVRRERERRVIMDEDDLTPGELGQFELLPRDIGHTTAADVVQILENDTGSQ